MSYRGIDYLRKKLEQKRVRVDLRYRYYDMHMGLKNYGTSIPASMRDMWAPLGWCGKAVDSLADRLVWRGFENDDFDIESILLMNNADILIDSAITSALIGACSFIYIYRPTYGTPRMQVIDASNATGIIDPITNMLTEGYAVLARNDNGLATREAYFTQQQTLIYEGGKLAGTLDHECPYALLVPVINRPDARRPFGHSRISRTQMGIVQTAMRTLQRSEVCAEFYSFPQKYLLGTDPEMEPLPRWEASMSALLQITKDSEGDKPVAGQFSVGSMSPYTEHLRTMAALFAGESGLTLDDLGFVTDNPSSAEAIKSSHENLRLMARKAQRNFGTALLNVGYLAACLRDDVAYRREQYARTRCTWEPVFEPDVSALSGIGDAVGKINEAVPGYFGARNLRDLTGIAANEGAEG